VFKQLDIDGEGQLNIVQLRKTLTNYPTDGMFTDISSMVSAMKRCSLTPGEYWCHHYQRLLHQQPYYLWLLKVMLCDSLFVCFY